MEKEIKLYQEIAAREKASRKAAEALLEKISLKLYEQTQRDKKAREDLLSLNKHLTNIMSSAPDGVITCSKDLKILNFNSTAAKQLKIEINQARGKSLPEFIPELVPKIREQNRRDFEINEVSVHSANGAHFVADIRGKLSERGQEKYFLFFVHDITKRLAVREEKKQMHLQFDEARRLEAIGALSAGIAHEINTPIQYIGDNLGFLYEKMEKIHGAYLNYAALSSALTAHMNPIELVELINQYNKEIRLPVLIGDIEEAICESLQGIDQVRDIILLMKEFAHPGQTESNEADINETIIGVIKITNSSHKGVANVELDLCENLPLLNCRRNQIRQVILNMVLNAIDAIEETNCLPGKIRIETRSDTSHLHILISDTGPGIPESLVKKVFDPFFTTKPVGKGTGQGLALAKEFIVAGHQGDLKLVQIEGFQTSFQISLPLHQPINTTLEHNHVA